MNEVNEVNDRAELSWQAIASRPMPAELRSQVEALRAWAHGSDARALQLWACFHPAVAEIDARRTGDDAEFNPLGIDDEKLFAARDVLIQLRDTLLLPSLLSAAARDILVLSEAIKSLYGIIDRCCTEKPEGWGESRSPAQIDRESEWDRPGVG